MLLIEINIKKLIEYMTLWNREYLPSLRFHGQDDKEAVWVVGNVLISGIEIAPERILIEINNFDLQGTNDIAKSITQKIIQLLKRSFPVDDSKDASRAYDIMKRQAERTLRSFPIMFSNTSLDAKAEAEFKASEREKHPDITPKELADKWIDFCNLVEQQRVLKSEQERQRHMSADEAVKEWWDKRF